MSRSPRKEASSLRGAEPKTKGKGRSRRSSSSDKNNKQPFLEEDEFSDVVISVGDKKLYSNTCMLAYSSPVLREMLTNGKDGKDKDAKGGKPGKSSGPSGGKDKDLDLSKYSYADVCDMLAYIDPRIETELTDDEAARLLPLASEYDIKGLLKDCSKTLIESYRGMKKGRRSGFIPIDTSLKYLRITDKYDNDYIKELQDLCIDELANCGSPGIAQRVATEDLEEPTKRKFMQKKLAITTSLLEQERRARTEQSETRKSTIWKK